MPNRYFGTDGIRGKYNSSFLNEKFIRYLGYSIAEEFRSANNKNVSIGHDKENISDPIMQDECKKAALDTKFEPSNEIEDLQIAEIVYSFKFKKL